MNKLTVYAMPVEDCWKDMARIPSHYRVGANGKSLGRAKICKLTINNRHKLLAIRGCSGNDAIILLDSPTRVELDLRVGTAYEVVLHPVGWLGYWLWAWNAADPAYRVPAQISMISLLLGIFGLFLGAVSLWPLVSPWFNSR